MNAIIIIMALVVAYLTPMFIIKAIKSDGDRSQNYTIYLEYVYLYYFYIWQRY